MQKWLKQEVDLRSRSVNETTVVGADDKLSMPGCHKAVARCCAIIVTYRSGRVVEDAVTSFMQHHDPVIDGIVIVDNDSGVEYVEYLKHFTRRMRYVDVITRDTNAGFGAACNEGARWAHRVGYSYYLFLNPDTKTLGRLDQLFQYLANHTSFWAGTPNILFPGGQAASTGFSFSRPARLSLHLAWEAMKVFRIPKRIVGAAARLFLRDSVTRGNALKQLGQEQAAKRTLEVDWVCGAALCVKAGRFWELDGFDEGYFMYFEDEDLCRRIGILGGGVVVVPSGPIEHELGWVGGGARQSRKRRKMKYVSFQRYVATYHAETYITRAFLLALGFLRIRVLGL